MHSISGLGFPLGEQAENLRAALRELVRREIAPRAAEIDAQGCCPPALWKQIGKMGLFGVAVPKRYGGLGMGYRAQVMAVEELSRGSASMGLVYGVHSGLCVHHIFLHGTEEQRRRFLPPMIDGEWVGALAMSEKDAGSNVAAMKLRATRTEGGFFLNGSKMWITNGPTADVVIVYAKTSPEKGAMGITCFLVPESTPGLQAGPPLDKLGMAASPTSALHFEQCLVPEKNILGAVDRGIELLMSGLDLERLILAGGPLGIMGACMDLVLPYVHKRKQFGQPIGEFQLMQGKLADMYTTWNAARSYVYTVAATADAGEDIRKDGTGAILFAAERATWMALEAIQCLGGRGYLTSSPAGRLLRDAKVYEIAAGTTEIRRMVVGGRLVEEMG